MSGDYGYYRHESGLYVYDLGNYATTAWPVSLTQSECLDVLIQMANALPVEDEMRITLMGPYKHSYDKIKLNDLSRKEKKKWIKKGDHANIFFGLETREEFFCYQQPIGADGFDELGALVQQNRSEFLARWVERTSNISKDVAYDFMNSHLSKVKFD